jgi:rhodanese-related sulfurtransferase
VLVAGGGCGKGVSEKTIAYASLDEVRELQGEDESDPRTLLLIDPRPLRRYAEGHIPGAMTLQLPEVPAYGGRDPRLQGHDHLIVYGEDPASPTARAMTKRLLAIGYEGVRLFAGGMEAWIEADLPVETSEMPAPED